MLHESVLGSSRFSLKKKSILEIDFQSTVFDRKINSREERPQHFCKVLVS